MRASFFMPTGTNVGATPAVSITPVQVFCDDVTSLFISGTVTVNIGGADPATYDAADFGSAQRIIQQINNAMQSGAGASVLIVDIPTALTWTSLTPNTVSVNSQYTTIEVAGSGFSNANITQLQFQDTSTPPNIVQVQLFNLDSNTSISIENLLTFFTVAGTYTLYYSTDYGATWNTTGLNMTAS